MNRKLGLKMVAVGALMLVIWAALGMVGSVIDERKQYREEAVKFIEASYAGPQTLVGPVLVRPYTQTTETTERDGKGANTIVEHTAELLATTFPHELKVTGRLAPTQLRHGLYKVTVYEFDGQMNGSMQVTDPITEGKVVWGEPYLALAVADVRGIVGTPKVRVNGVEATMVQGAATVGGWQSNLRVPLRGIAMQGELEFSIALDLGGTETLGLAPVGDSNHVELSSAWASPLFAAQFLPRTRTVGADGFTASWDVSSLASGTQGQMMAAHAADVPVKPLDMMDVSLLTPIDPYKLSDRATKYGVLFVVLTFGGFFLFEMMKELPIHPVQYLLVGFGLAMFFLLLISFSEHMAFAAAYAIASAASIGLLAFYLSHVLRSVGRGLGFGGMLATVYAAMYGLLVSEDNALILGSLMLFGVLAAVMVVTRRVDWYRGKGAALPPPLAV